MYSQQTLKNDDYQQNINTLNMELEQLRRENLFLRKKLDRVKPKEEPKKTIRSKQFMEEANSSNPKTSQSALVCLLKELALIKDNVKRVFPNNSTLKNIRHINLQVDQNICEQVLIKGLEKISLSRAQDRYRILLSVFDEYHKICLAHETKISQTLNEAADYVRRLNQVLSVRMNHIKKSHDLVENKMGILKLVHQQTKQQTNSGLKEIKKMLHRFSDQIMEHQTAHKSGSQFKDQT